MAAFTTTSPASTYVINTLILIAVIAVVGVVASYVMLNRSPADRTVAAIAAPADVPSQAPAELRHAD